MHSAAVRGRLKECEDRKYADQGRISLLQKKKDELTELVLIIEGQVRKLLVTKESPDADLVALDVE